LLFAHFHESGIFREKAITRMNGIGLACPGDFQYLFRIEIAVYCFCRPDEIGFIGEFYVKGIGISFRIYGDGTYTYLPAGSDYPNGYFATVGYQDFLKQDFSPSGFLYQAQLNSRYK
jgi:hypothetical protein